MNIKIFLGAVLVVALGTGIFFWHLGRSSDPLSSGPTPALPASEVSTTPGNDDPIRGRGNLAALLALSRNLECAVAHDVDPQFSSEGTVFLSEGKIRGDFLTGLRGEQVLSSMIIRDNTMYLWSIIDGQAWGMRSVLGVEVSEREGAALETQEPIGLEDEIQYDCKPWAYVDGSVFVPPSDVLFRDLTTIMEQGMEYGTTFEATVAETQATPQPSSDESCTACAAVVDTAARELCEIQFACGLQPN